jgi:feruloyl esterase
VLVPYGQEASPALPIAPADEPTPCEELAAAKLPSTTITLAQLVPAGGFVPPAGAPAMGPPPAWNRLPAFCRIAATVSPAPDSEIDLEVWMPAEGWNGKLVGTGNGGMAGAISFQSMAEPLARGYAVTNTNTGHYGDGADASFAVGHPEKLVDFAWRAVHEMTVKAKALVARHYGAPARHAYWVGCSSGGRQGLVEAQRYPDDYDAIAASAPANDWFPLMAHAVMIQRVLTDRTGGLPPAKLNLLRNAAVSACDARDGVTDRVIDQPDACSFDPATIRCTESGAADCLTASEVEAARRVYRGVVHPATGAQIFPGTEPASEHEWAAFRPGAFPIGVNFWRDLVVGDRDWDPASLDAADIERAIAADTAGLTATEPDLSAFVASGGKLLLWHGWTDGLIPPRNTIRYYESVLATIGAEKAKDSVRLFLAPGVDHCSGGYGAYDFDALEVLEAWVERGRRPDRIVASRPLPDGALRTRPLCPFPEIGRYSGTGSSDDAASFECGPPTAP